MGWSTGLATRRRAGRLTGADSSCMCAPNYVASYAPDASPDLWQRYLAIIFDGLRPEGGHPLPPPPPAAP